MKKLIFAALFAIVAVPAYAFDEVSAASGNTSVSAPAGSGMASKLGMFLGGMLKAPVSIGRDLVSGIKSGMAGDSAATLHTAETETHMAPVEHRTAPAGGFASNQAPSAMSTSQNQPLEKAVASKKRASKSSQSAHGMGGVRHPAGHTGSLGVLSASASNK